MVLCDKCIKTDNRKTSLVVLYSQNYAAGIPIKIPT